MNIYNSEIWISDLDEVITTFTALNQLEGKSILITGSTGLICSALIDVLIRWNETHTRKITIYAAGRNEKNVKSRFGLYFDYSWFNFIQYDANREDNQYCDGVDYVIHGAGNASPNRIIEEPVETMMSNFIGLKNILKYSKDRCVKRVLFISSSEVYGINESNEANKINDYGYIDILNPRNSYAIGKRAAETLCASYYSEYHVDSVVVRPGHIYGPSAQEGDNRVSSYWAYEAAKGNDLVMKSDGLQVRSYCYCLDCATAILYVLLYGKPMGAYNISNDDSIINIKTLGEILAKNSNTKLKREAPSLEDKRGFNPMRNSSIDNRELLELGWKGIFNAERGLNHTVNILKEMINAEKNEGF